MRKEEKIDYIKNFLVEGKNQPVKFIKTMKVTKGVDCDIYNFVGDSSKDLGIIKIDPDSETPLQRVLKGDRTIEGYILGKGKLTVTKTDGKQEIYIVGVKSKEPIEVTVEIGQTMQWESDKESKLVAYEICFPPYKDGRFENLQSN